MSRNDITGDSITTKGVLSEKGRANFDLIFKKVPPYQCRFCGNPSWIAPEDQTPPADYCHESEHGWPE